VHLAGEVPNFKPGTVDRALGGGDSPAALRNCLLVGSMFEMLSMRDAARLGQEVAAILGHHAAYADGWRISETRNPLIIYDVIFVAVISN